MRLHFEPRFKHYYKGNKFVVIPCKYPAQQYDQIGCTIKIAEDENHKIVGVHGTIKFPDNLSACLKKKEEVAKEDDKKRLNFVGQEYNKADYIYTNYIYEVDIRYNNKYKIPENFKEFDKLIIDEIPIYTIYKRIN